jgi:cytochrome bd-type quinol oxidase subunit 1
MSFQLGPHWPGFMKRSGDITGPLLSHEVLSAFFLEATVLGARLFGHGSRRRARASGGYVSRRLRHDDERKRRVGPPQI